jgi:hypothetical protein
MRFVALPFGEKKDGPGNKIAELRNPPYLFPLRYRID